jgi:hypothetical protein
MTLLVIALTTTFVIGTSAVIYYNRNSYSRL